MAGICAHQAPTYVHQLVCRGCRKLQYGYVMIQKNLSVRHYDCVQDGYGARLLREEVTEDDIADIISRWTGIPVSKLVASEREKLLHLDAELPPPRHWPGRGCGGGRGRHPEVRARISCDRKMPPYLAAMT